MGNFTYLKIFYHSEIQDSDSQNEDIVEAGVRRYIFHHFLLSIRLISGVHPPDRTVDASSTKKNEENKTIHLSSDQKPCDIPLYYHGNLRYPPKATPPKK